jgi:predicted MFS family arabinose efflux permease
MTGPLLSDRGLTLEQIGVVTGVAGATAGVLGAFVGGASLLRIGHREALLAAGALQALGLAGYLLVVAGLQHVYAIGAIVYFEQFADGLSTVALFTLMMDRCRAHSPGTDYSLQASLMVTVTGVAAMLGGWFTEQLGYGSVFATAAVLTLLALVPAALFFRSQALHPAGRRGIS